MKKWFQAATLLAATLFLGGCPTIHHGSNDSEYHGPGHHHHHPFSQPTPAAQEAPATAP